MINAEEVEIPNFEWIPNYEDFKDRVKRTTPSSDVIDRPSVGPHCIHIRGRIICLKRKLKNYSLQSIGQTILEKVKLYI